MTCPPSFCPFFVMLKYVNTGIVFSEIPDEVTLSINISRCPCHCPGCHSQYLWEDIGVPLTPDELDRLVGLYGEEITCVALMGGDAEPHTVSALAAYLRSAYPRLKVAWYSGRSILPKAIDKPLFHYIKLGPFIQHLGPLNQPTTNQRLYQQTAPGEFTDITSRFWR